MTDSKQNPEVNLNGEDEVVTLSKEEHQKLVEENANLNQDKSNLVNEIKELREKKQLTDSEKAELAEKVKSLETSRNTTPVEADEVKAAAEEVVNRIFSKKEAETREETQQRAMKKFLQSNPQFSTENDLGGLKKSALDKKLAMFNIGNLKTEDEFLSAFNDANSLLGGNKPTEEAPENNIPNATDTGVTPKQVDVHELSSKELKIINQFMGGDKDKYIKIKAKRPDYVASLLRNIY